MSARVILCGLLIVALAGGEVAAAAAQRSVSEAASQAAASLAGEVRVVADSDTNSLLIMTAPGNFERVRAILDDLDRATPQVLIKVLIAEVTHDRTVDLGVEFSVLNLPNVTDDSVAFTDFGVASATQGLIFRGVGDDALATIRALEIEGKLEILSRPYILASDNQQATITVGDEVPFVTNTRTTETGQTINTIQYQDIGIILNVTPHINPDGLVIMDVNPEISAVTDSTVPISESLSATVINKRSASTRVAVRDGQTIVIGGLMEDRKTQGVRKVPILGDIPLLGALFRRTVTDKVKTELLIFLTPHVAPEPDMLRAMSDDEMTGVHIVPGAVEPGAFDGHMRGMGLGRGQPTGLEGAESIELLELPLPGSELQPPAGAAVDALPVRPGQAGRGGRGRPDR
ncbi:MAG: type II secretion system protein GspD [Candidatus Brocadiaceae bacterium]|nr:type II secretion system protein GspD [Candidatus Brocadiaceae bacterium]